ncbi:hypothetical protein ACLMJK_007954 [Lecanora helva]
MTTRKKIAVLAIFSLGALTLAASITRAVFYLQLLNAEKTVARTYDPNMINTNGIYWMLVETGLALIAVNLPLLYGSFKQEGIETVIRKVRSFASLRSSSPNSAKSSKASSARKASDEYNLRSDQIELVHGAQGHSNSTAVRADAYNLRDVEEGRIKLTTTYDVDQYKR